MFRRSCFLSLLVGSVALAGPLHAGSTPAQDLTALDGVWQSGPVPASDGRGTGTLKLQLAGRPGTQGGRGKLEIATRSGGRSTSSTRTFTYRLVEQGGVRQLVVPASRLNAGLILTYNVKGDQLVLTGPVASRRIVYQLQNVALRQVAKKANLDAPAAAGGTPRGGAAVRFTGDVFDFAQAAVRENRLADSGEKGFALGNNRYRDVAADGGVLIGFQVGQGKFVNNTVINALRPIYLTRGGERLGLWLGPPPAEPITVKAKTGYVVGGVSLRAGILIDGLSVTFVKLGASGLDLGDQYVSPAVGGTGGNPQALGGQGALYVGIYGHLNGQRSPVSLGLVAAVPKE